MEKNKGLFSIRKHHVGNFSDRKKGRKRKGGRLRQSMGFLLAAALIFNTLPANGLTVSASGREAELCKHHQEHNADCGYIPKSEDGEGSPCTYECRICPVEDLIADLPDKVTEDNADDVRAQLEEILALYGELTEDEQGQIDLSSCYALQGALDNANAPVQAAEEINISQNRQNILTEEDGGCPGHTFTGTAQAVMIYVASGTHDVTFSNLTISQSAMVGIAPSATMNLTIEGTNTIPASNNLAGIYVPVSATLIINGTGSLNVSGSSSAGIGGAAFVPDENSSDGDPNCGTVEIKGGTVTATGGSGCAGIGGGVSADYSPGNGGTVTISGGTVTAAGGADSSGRLGGAGIGGSIGETDGSRAGSGGSLTISGGDVTLTAGHSTAYGFGQGTGKAPGGTCELTLTDASYLDSSTTLDPNGKYTINGDPTADMIVVPEGLVYTGQAQDLDGKIYIDDSKTGTGTYFEQTFTVKASAEDWTYTINPSEVKAAGDYTVTFSKEGHTSISKTFTVAQSGTDLTDGKVKTYNGETETTSFTASDTITVKATPTATGAAPQKAAARLQGGPDTGQMALYVGDMLVSSEAADADADGTYTMTVSAADVLTLGGVKPNGNAITLTAKFVGNDNMADAAGTVDVNITAVAMAEKGGTVIGYYDESNLADAFAEDSGNDGATITLLDNITTSKQINVYTDNLTLDLNGKTYTCTQNDFQIFFVSLTIKGSGAITTSGFYCLAVDEGTLNIESGSFSANESAVYVVNGGTLQLTGGSFTGNQNAIAYASGDVTAALANYGGADAPHYAFYQGSSPYTPSGRSLPKGTFTVQECEHDGVEVKGLGGGKHGLTCPYCGYHSEHTTTLTATASGNTVTLNGGCDTEGCGYQTTLGTASFTFPKVTYGQSGDVTCAWDGPTGYYGQIEVVVGSESQFDKNEDENIVERSWTLAQLFGSTEVTAGKHKLKVSFFSDVWSNECELDFTIAPAPLTADMVTLSAESATYNGTEQKPTVTVAGLVEGTDYEVSYTRGGVVTNDFTSAGAVNITVTGKGNYGGEVEKTFTIKQAESDVGTVTAETLENTLDVSQVVLSRTNQILAGTLMLTDSALKYGTNTYTWKFTPDNTNYKTVTGEVEVTVDDTASPTGEISIGTNKWNSFLNTITFGLFFKETEQITITAQDNESGVASVSYYISDSGLTEDEVKVLDSWTAGNTDKTTFRISQKESCVVYAKITDHQGNMTYISSDGLLFDGTLPSITGVTDGETYCTSQTVIVTDDNLESVTVNGKEQIVSDGKFTLDVKFDTAAIVITAEDRAGNVTNVTVNAGHSYGTEWKSDSNGHWQECAVCGDKSKVSAHTEDSGTATKPATQTETGIRTYKCSVCGYVMRTEEIAKLPQSHSHNYGTEWKFDSSNHWLECDCGEKSGIAAHTEDSGTVTKLATERETGIRTYKCSVCGCAIRTEIIEKLSPAPKKQPQGTVTLEEMRKNSEKLDSAISIKWKRNALALKWKKAAGADGYDIFAAQSGKKINKKSLVKTVKNGKISVSLAKIAGIKISGQKAYSVKIKAWKYVGGKKIYIGESKTYHIVGKENKKYTNVKKLKKKKYTLKKGRSAHIQVMVIKESKKKKLLPKSYGPALQYRSGNEKIATVTSKGKVKAKKKGICYIYVTALNGVRTRIKITVK